MPDDLWSDPTAPSFEPPTPIGAPAAPPIPRPSEEVRVHPAPPPPAPAPSAGPAASAPPPSAPPPSAARPGDPMPSYGPSADRPPADARIQLGPPRDPHLPTGAWLLCFASIVALIPSFFLVGIPSLIFGARAAMSSAPAAERDRLIRRGWTALVVNIAAVVVAGATVLLVLLSRARA